MSTPARKTSRAAQRMSTYRERMREKGFRQKTIWVPDASNPKVLARYRRAAEAIAVSDPAGDDIRAFLEAAHADLFKDEPPYDWGDKEP